MSRDLRLYSLVFLIMLMLLGEPVRADYGEGTGCPTIAVPVQLGAHSMWGGEYENDNRNLFPESGDIDIIDDGQGNLYLCTLDVYEGTFYDGANHLWVLDDDITCGIDQGGDFRAGDLY